MNKKTLRLVTTGVMLAVATILSMIKVYELPFGGSITLFSMIPIMLLGYKYGIKWGLCSGLIYGILQALLGVSGNAFAGMTGWTLIGMLALDYLFAFMPLGTAGIFRGKIKNHVVAFSLGAVVGGLLRLAVHFLSGLILWGSYAEAFFSEINNSFAQSVLANYSGTGLAAVYSIFYNSSYMIPEIIVSVVGVISIMAIKPIRKQVIDR